MTLRSDTLNAHADATRYARSLVRRTKRELRSNDDRIRARLFAALDGRRTLSRVNGLVSAIASLRQDTFTGILNFLETELTEFSMAEVQVARADLDLDRIPQVPSVSSERIRGRTLRSWIDGLKQADRNRIEAEVHMGAADGITTSRIIRRVMGTVRARGRDGLLGTTERQLTPLITTAVMHFFSVVRGNAAEMAGLDEIYETLPGRIEHSDVCRQLNGTVFEAGEGPRPPQHFNCRSVRIPLLEET